MSLNSNKLNIYFNNIYNENTTKCLKKYNLICDSIFTNYIYWFSIFINCIILSYLFGINELPTYINIFIAPDSHVEPIFFPKSVNNILLSTEDALITQ